jgi:hypothetical protein
MPENELDVDDETLDAMSFADLDALHIRLSNDLDQQKAAIRRVRERKDRLAAEQSVREKMGAMSPAEREAFARIAAEPPKSS